MTSEAFQSCAVQIVVAMEQRQEGSRYCWYSWPFWWVGCDCKIQMLAYLYNQDMFCTLSEDKPSLLLLPGEDSGIRFGDESESKHPLAWAGREEKMNSGKFFPFPQIHLWPVCDALGKATPRKEKTCSARSLLGRVFPPTPADDYLSLKAWYYLQLFQNYQAGVNNPVFLRAKTCECQLPL